MSETIRDWIIASDGTGKWPFGFICLRCKATAQISTPVKLEKFAEEAESFTEKHKDCQEKKI